MNKLSVKTGAVCVLGIVGYKLFCPKDEPSLLYKACMNGYTNVARILLMMGAEVDKSVDYITPFQIACYRGHVDTAELLLDYGANIDRKYIYRGFGALGYAPSNKETPLFDACRKGHDDMIRILLKRGADVNHKNVHDQTPLEMAFIYNRMESVRIMLDYINIVHIPVHQLCNIKNIKGLKMLFDKGIDVNGLHYDKPPLIYACIKGYIDVAKLLLENKANVNEAYCKTYPLTYACERDDIYMVRLLLEHKADVNNESYPSLMSVKNTDIAKILIDHGADVNYNSFNSTPLYKACKTGDIHMVRLLLKYGAEVHHVIDDYSLLQITCKLGYTDIALILLDAGMDIDGTTTIVSPLSLAVIYKRIQTMVMLITHGASNIDDRQYSFSQYFCYDKAKRIVRDDLLMVKNIEEDDDFPLCKDIKGIVMTYITNLDLDLNDFKYV